MVVLVLVVVVVVVVLMLLLRANYPSPPLIFDSNFAIVSPPSRSN